MKPKVIVLYGGRSTEHLISRRSAAFVLRNLDRSKFDVMAIAIDEEGKWLPQEADALLASMELENLAELPILEISENDGLALPESTTQGLATLKSTLTPASPEPHRKAEEVVVFPVLHGTFGEDGTIQGFFDLAEVAYVGPDVLGSSSGIDKVVTKERVRQAGIPVVPWKHIRIEKYESDPQKFADACFEQLKSPLFVKPATLGSSVGISKVSNRAQFHKACSEAFRFDGKILIEQAINAREIECAALGGYEPEISLAGEVENHGDFYSYEAKYIDTAASTIKVPAQLSESEMKWVREQSKVVFEVLDLYGMARLDWFLDKDTGVFYFNEVNTIPGFTEISQYPQLWKHSGVEGKELITRLVELALERRKRRDRLDRRKT